MLLGTTRRRPCWKPPSGTSHACPRHQLATTDFDSLRGGFLSVPGRHGSIEGKYTDAGVPGCSLDASSTRNMETLDGRDGVAQAMIISHGFSIEISPTPEHQGTSSNPWEHMRRVPRKPPPIGVGTALGLGPHCTTILPLPASPRADHPPRGMMNPVSRWPVCERTLAKSRLRLEPIARTHCPGRLQIRRGITAYHHAHGRGREIAINHGSGNRLLRARRASTYKFTHKRS